MPIKVRLRQRDGKSCKQRCMTLTAVGMIGQPAFRDAVKAPAMRTDNMNSFTHTGPDTPV